MTHGVQGIGRREVTSSAPKPSVGLPRGWWPIAFSSEISQHPKPFRLGTRDIAVYRDLQGVVRAVDDSCPHRRLPLSMGRITEDGYLQCAYHGWCFDGDTGQCTSIPNMSTDEKVPRSMKVAVFSTAENMADALGWNLRTPHLAPRVGPPTGEEPEEGTTMFDTRVSNGLVLMWTGDALPEGEVLSMSPGESDTASFSGKIEIRAPHRDVSDAVLCNPGALLGIGWLIGSGDEIHDPIIEEGDATVTVRRERRALNPRRVSTYGSVVRRVISSSTTTAWSSGLTWIEVPGVGPWPAVSMVIALTPISPYRTVLRWRGLCDGAPMAQWFGRAAAFAGQLSRKRMVARAQDVVDASQGSLDRGLDRLRILRTSPE